MLVILAFFVVCFAPVMFQGRFFLMLDAFTEMLPERVVAWNAIRHGEFPLWTPLILSGYPLLSMAQIGLAYPLTWGYLFLPPYWAEQIYVLAPFLLTPVFTFCYTRYIGRTSIAAMLSALAYGYGGVLISPDIPNGLLPNSMMWLPLFLIALERSRKKRFISSLLWATSAYAMSVLTGVGQGFLLVAILGLAYALFLVVFDARLNENSVMARSVLTRWQPLLVSVGAVSFSAGIAAFQILETMRAQRRSIRSALNYEMFSDPSPTFWALIKFVVAPPFYSFQDVCTAYVAPVVLLLAAIPVYYLVRRRVKDTRIYFWLGAGVSAWILMMGSNTFVYRILYHVPVLNKFREPPRYAVIFTLAVAILAAYGFDTLTKIISPSVESESRRRGRLVSTLVILVLTIAVGLIWIKPLIRLDLIGFLSVKASFTVLAVLGLLHALKTVPPVQNLLTVFALSLACFVEPFALISNWWWPKTKPANRVISPTMPTRFLQQFPADQNRVYTFVELFSEEFNENPAVDCPNLTMLHGLQNVAGYEPLMLQRYSRALGNVWLDAVTTLDGREPDRNLFQSNSNVLDLLNNTYLLTFSNPLLLFENSIEHEGIAFAKRSTKIDLLPGRHVGFSAMMARADTVAIVSALANSSASQGMPIATVRATTMDGRIIERQLRAGIDTAEWAHERPDVRNTVQHSLAPIFETYPGDQQNSFSAYKYWTRIDIGPAESFDRVEITNLTQTMTLTIDRVTLLDSSNESSTALTLGAGPVDFKKWQPVYHHAGVMILKNNRAMARAWLVAKAEAVEQEEALQTIRGESEHPFDPRETVLLEVKKENLPLLPGGPISAGSSALITAYEPNRLVVETESPAPAVLVVSELNYPGWIANLDGERVPIHTGNFLLRSVVLPAGKHQVEMRYTAPAARNGALISGFSLLVMFGLAVGARWRHRKRSGLSKKFLGES